MKKKLLRCLLTLCMLASIIVVMPVTANAATSGTCGDNLTWNLDDGILTISGSGAMYDWDDNCSPWSGNTSIIEIIISDNVTSIGCNAFAECDNLLYVTIPESVTEIGYSAFYSCDSLTDGDGYWYKDCFYVGDCLVHASMITRNDIIIKPGTRVIAYQSFGFSTNAKKFYTS